MQLRTGDAPARRWSTQVSPAVISTIVGLGRRSAPMEACGLIVPEPTLTGGHVIGLPNRASRLNAYVMEWDDVEAALEDWLDGVGAWYRDGEGVVETGGEVSFDYVIWHTHPDGGIGPSVRDMRLRRKQPPAMQRDVRHLVVTLPGGEAGLF